LPRQSAGSDSALAWAWRPRGGEQLLAGWRKYSGTGGTAERRDGLFVEDGDRFVFLDTASIDFVEAARDRPPRDPAAGTETHRLLQWVNGKPGRNPSKPIVRVVEMTSRPRDPRHPTTRAFRFCRTAYFFLAARPRPAGAARNEMPVRIAFC
jgi:hypothetical protein